MALAYLAGLMFSEEEQIWRPNCCISSCSGRSSARLICSERRQQSNRHDQPLVRNAAALCDARWTCPMLSRRRSARLDINQALEVRLTGRGTIRDRAIGDTHQRFRPTTSQMPSHTGLPHRALCARRSAAEPLVHHILHAFTDALQALNRDVSDLLF